jgi:hypothetical protein
VKSRIRIVAALGATLALGVSALAYADGASENTSTVNASLSPNKLSKSKYKTSSLDSGVTTYANNDPNAHVNFPTTKTVLDYDDDSKVDVTVVKNCTTDLSQLNPSQAKAACPKSILGSGKAHAVVVNSPVNDIKVTAFRNGGKILLYTYSATLDGASPGSTTDVTGTLSKDSGDFGTKATFPVPPLLGGQAALTLFQVKLNKGIKARCHDGNKTFNSKGTFTYSDSSKETATNKSKCSVKHKH